MGGSNTSDEGQQSAGHCAVRVSDSERGIDATFELTPDPWRNVVYGVGPENPRVAAYGGAWVPVNVPGGMSVREFYDAVLRSAYKVGRAYNGKFYWPGGDLNSNSFVYRTITGAGGTVPSAAAAMFRYAPGICGGTGTAKGSNCR